MKDRSACLAIAITLAFSLPLPGLFARNNRARANGLWRDDF